MPSVHVRQTDLLSAAYVELSFCGEHFREIGERVSVWCNLNVIHHIPTQREIKCFGKIGLRLWHYEYVMVA